MSPSSIASGAATGAVNDSPKLKLEIVSTQPGGSGDGDAFRAALERHMQTGNAGKTRAAGSDKISLGDKMIERADTLSTDVKNDQKYVSKMLERATSTGDSMLLMKAMMALNDYQMRVQFVSKTVSKATSSLDQLTKLQ